MKSERKIVINNLNERVRHLSKNDFIIISKIFIISFTAFSILANVIPYYDGSDSYVYGISAINISNGSFEIINELLQETGDTKFVPKQWVKTTSNTSIPIGGLGQYGLVTVSYIVNGYYGLFYIMPIITILLFITTERITTKLFGGLAGLFTLLFLVSDWMIFQNGVQLLNDNVFAFIFILGILFFVKFFHTKKPIFILIASSFFVASTFFRINGIVFFPVEIMALLVYYLYEKIQVRKQNESSKLSISNTWFFIRNILGDILKIKNFKIPVFLISPWLVFALVWFSFNAYYFGDSLTNYEAERKITMEVISDENDSILEIEKRKRLANVNPFRSLVEFDSERLLWMSYYSVALSPDPLKNILKYITTTDKKEDWHAENWLSLVSLSFIFLAGLMSVKLKVFRTEVFLFSLFIASFILFFSADYVAPSLSYAPSGDIQDRYMIPASILSFMLFSIVLIKTHKIMQKKNERKFVVARNFLIVLIIAFFIGTIYTMPSVQDLFQNGIHFNNPENYIERFPLDLEGLSEHSIVVGDMGRRAVEYGAIPMFPYEGYFRNNPEWIPENLNPQVIENIKEFLKEGRDMYTFKIDMRPIDEKYFRFLEAEHGIILKEHSNSFCKLILVENFSELENESDKNCYSNIKDTSLKVWPVWLKTPDYFFQNIPNN